MAWKLGLTYLRKDATCCELRAAFKESQKLQRLLDRADGVDDSDTMLEEDGAVQLSSGANAVQQLSSAPGGNAV